VDDLIGWLRAQLDEDAAVARAAADCHDEDSPTWAVITPGFVHNGDDGMWSRLTRVDRDAVADHMARFDPARVLAEVEAKREIVDQHGPTEDGTCRLCLYLPLPCITLRLLALPYTDRPGYRDEWRP
jgi:hypothetical protein